VRFGIAIFAALFVMATAPLHADPRSDLTAQISALTADAKYSDALVKAEALADLTKGEDSGNNAPYAEALSWIAFLHEVTGDVQGASSYFERAAAIYEKVLPADHPDLATSLNNLGFDRYRLGHYREAEALYQRALDIRERVLPENHPAIADTLNNLAELYKAVERIDEAIPLLNRALEMRSRSLPPDDPRIASSLQNLAGAMELDPRGDKFVAAQKLLERALAIRLKSQRPGHPEIAGAISKLATNLFNQNKFSDAEARFTEALAIRRASQPPNHPDIALTLAGLSLSQIEQKKYAIAETGLREVLAIREAVLAPNSQTTGEAHRYLARTLMLQKRPLEALEEMRRGTAIVMARDDRTPKAREHLAEHLGILADMPADGPVSAEIRYSDSYLLGQRLSESEAASAVATMASRYATQDAELQQLVRERETIDLRLDYLEKQLTADLSRPPAERHSNTRSQMTELELRRKVIDDRFRKDFPFYFGLIKPDPLPLAETAALLAPGEALISIVTTPDCTYVWGITREAHAWHKVAVTSAWLEQSVKTLRSALDTEDLKKNISHDGSLLDLGLAHDIYAKLLEPLEPVFKDKTHLLIVPTGALTSLPFQVLVTKQPGITHPSIGQLPAYGEADWLIRRHAISVVPSVTSLKALRQLKRPAETRKPMIGFGNPRLARRVSAAEPATAPVRVAEAQTRGADLSARDKLKTRSILNSLEELPGTEQELKTIARDLGATDADLRLGEAATETSVKTTDLSVYNVVYFATHGLVADDIKGLNEPALVLTPPDDPTDMDDGLLTASEISETLKLNADWVVLAACNTAAESKPGAEALSGLAKSFFHAGARALLVSHWRVDSEAAAKLTTAAFAAQAHDKSIGRAEALRQAMLAQIEKKPAQPGDLWDAYPAFWAAFSVVGEGGAP
jgi:CHAT domain-containing protein